MYTIHSAVKTYRDIRTGEPYQMLVWWMTPSTNSQESKWTSLENLLLSRAREESPEAYKAMLEKLQ